MVLNISHKDKIKYQESLKPRKTRARTKRTSLLSEKSKNQAFKQFAKIGVCESGSEVQVDEHMKMNDNYMRTGPYRPKKK
ncbi:MAG: hypothetical protein ACE5E9_07125 [Nitrospinaceae bacterium]